MFKLHVLQARYGDCLLLEFGAESAPHYALIDGGPKGTYDATLRHVLQALPKPRPTLELDLVVLSHIDEDHIQGLLDLFEAMGGPLDPQKDLRVAIRELWHNAFNEVVGEAVAATLARTLDRAGAARSGMPGATRAFRSIEQGEQLTDLSERLHIPRNRSVAPAPLGEHPLGERFVALDQGAAAVPLENLNLHIVGPTAKSLEALRTDWQAWQDEQERRLLAGEELSERGARQLDTSVPNLSSIMLLVESAGKRLLLTGDGRSDDLALGLQQAGFLAPKGTLHVDVLKLPHHGSKRNITADFLRRVTADTYIVSASGYHGHPSLETLKAIVTAARDQHRAITIAATNETSATRSLLKTCKPGTYGYHLELLPKGKHEFILTL